MSQAQEAGWSVVFPGCGWSDLLLQKSGGEGACLTLGVRAGPGRGAGRQTQPGLSRRALPCGVGTMGR